MGILVGARMSRIFVVGGAGYIGSHCCKALAESGFEPIVYDNLSTGHREFVKWGQLIEGDVRDGAQLTKAIHDAHPEAVMHFAALASVGESVAHPERYYDVNVVGGLRLLEAMLANDVNKLVFSSTCAVYGEPETIPIVESTPTNPINPYGASKLTFERMLADFDVAHGLMSTRLRYFNAAGADPVGEIGEWRANETLLIPLAIRAVLGRGPSLRIFGSDYATPDGTAIRDYIHVNDLASAHVAALRHLINDGVSDTLNLGTGTGASVNEVIKTIETVTGRTVPSEPSQRRAGDPPCLVADAARANAVLGWHAERSNLANIVEDAWRWHRRRNDA